MITDINNKSKISKLDRTKLPTHWNDYFEYKIDDELSSLTKDELSKIVNQAKSKQEPYIDSQVIISDLLTELGKKHNFHRQFREKHPNLDSAQTLGMQLYHILIDDNDIWIYHPMKKSNHLFPHATYFK